jgi:hypothetical protein
MATHSPGESKNTGTQSPQALDFVCASKTLQVGFAVEAMIPQSRGGYAHATTCGGDLEKRIERVEVERAPAGGSNSRPRPSEPDGLGGARTSGRHQIKAARNVPFPQGFVTDRRRNRRRESDVLLTRLFPYLFSSDVMAIHSPQSSSPGSANGSPA